ncbi:MAG: helix-turn-helix transcriptional regulator [Opitutaceae bacterium]|nr:helix-turn-helix transcriptional regulator [Opitutaceae bacterium]
MTSSDPSSSSASIGGAPEVASLLEPAAVLAALCDPVRYSILRALADSEPVSVRDLAKRVGRAPDAVAKHLRVLRGARLVRLVSVPGADGRCQFHELPALFRARDGAGRPVLDFGAVVLRLG